MKEKKFLKWLAIRSLVILGCFAAVCIGARLFMPGELRETMNNLNYVGGSLPDEVTLEDFEFVCDEPEIVTVTSAMRKGDFVYLTMRAAGSEGGQVLMEIRNKETGDFLDSAMLHVEKSGRILNMSTGNFNGYRVIQIGLTLTTVAFALLLWAGYFKAKKLLGYSYHAIYCIGLAIWISLMGTLLVIDVVRNTNMINFYKTIAETPLTFLIVTLPVVLLFALALMISNFSLVRREGFRFTNVLATILSFVMIGSAGFILGIGSIGASGSLFKVNLWSSVMAMMAACYAILECFLLGAIICGTQAAKNNPSFDKDYIVILGCMIKGDGTLYPLIRARVDRGIRFYKEQLAATGKKAIFVPSGGQGKNEPISEAAAMKRYLLEQGIAPEQILVEDRSKNTRQNMQFSKELIGEGARAVFSTTNFHVFRSGIISRQVGFEADGMGSPTKWYFWPNAYVREVIGMLSYKWKSLVLLYVPTALFLVSFIFTFNA